MSQIAFFRKQISFWEFAGGNMTNGDKFWAGKLEKVDPAESRGQPLEKIQQTHWGILNAIWPILFAPCLTKTISVPNKGEFTAS